MCNLVLNWIYQTESSGLIPNAEVDKATPTSALTHPALDDANLSHTFSALIVERLPRHRCLRNRLRKGGNINI